ncbi:MAG: serine hydrolase [Verrucomicrobiota bacterium]
MRRSYGRGRRERGVWAALLGVVWLASVVGLGAEEVEGLPRASVEAMGMRSGVLGEMSAWVRSEGLDVRSMIILRRGQMIFEWYAGGVSRESDHNIFSITKSVVGTLAGIAVDEERLPGVDVRLGELFGGVAGVRGDGLKAGVRVEDLLTMRSGFPCARANRAEGPERDLFERINGAEDRTAEVFKLEMVGEPGGAFVYGNVEPQVMMTILESAYGEKGFALGDRLLFGPLGFENARWLFADETGAAPGGYGIRLRALDLAKLGQLYLQGGEWGGEQVVSEEWVAAAVADQTGTGYGYYWWTGMGEKKRAYAARGVRGQMIYVDPDEELVFVVTADLPLERVRAVMNTLTGEFVLRAIVGDAELESSEEETQALTVELEAAAEYVPEHRRGLPAWRLPQR